MAHSSDLHIEISLTWTTELPFLDRTRSSSVFSIQGTQWCLVFCVDRNNNYIISLRRTGPPSKSSQEESFTVTTFIQHPFLPESTVCGPVKTVEMKFKFPDRDIWSFRDKKSLLDNFPWLHNWGGLKIICLFQDVLRPSVLQTKNETISLSTQTDSGSPLSSAEDSSSLSKGKLSADKSVQACVEVPSDLESLSLDLCNLLEEKTIPDVKLRCGDRTTHAHRSVLAARSAVFAAMFQNKMLESERGIVDITDLDAAVLELLLKYVYSGKISSLCEDTARSLYVAGDKYAIHSLKKACSEWIVRNLTEENCLSFLILADAHGDDNFRDAVACFISQHLQVLRTPAWSRLNEDYPRVANNVYQKCFASNFSS